MGGSASRSGPTPFVQLDQIRDALMWWSGTIATIPAGWRFADGTFGVPDLRDSFLISAAEDLAGTALAVIEGSLAQSGGQVSHQHLMQLAPGVTGIPPAGTLNRFVPFKASYPVCWTLPVICACQGAVMESGLIVMWSGSIASIPAGWAFCNGASGTPDLRNQFVIAASEDDAGVATAIINGTRQQFGGDIDHDHTLQAGDRMLDIAPAGDTGITTDAKFNYPPCFALAYIMKL